MNLCIFEDNGYTKLLPLTYLRPVYDLRCGINTIREKIVRAYPGLPVSLLCRDYLKEVLKEDNPGLRINYLPEDRYLFVNGRVLFEDNLKKSINLESEGVYLQDNSVIAAVVKGDNLKPIRRKLGQPLEREDFKGLPVHGVKAKQLDYTWDFIHHNSGQIKEDFKVLSRGGIIAGGVYEGVSILERSNIYIAEDAQVKPGVILDAENGPIFIDKGAKVLPNATIIGPAFVGAGSTVKVGAKIYEGSSFGEVCKVGGEVEESIIHSYSNKQHDGFLGHAYLGQWVNLGAGTNNSDLKNNYGTVKVLVNGKIIDSGSMFVGATIGDHSKTGINTMLNTGTVIGVFSNVFGAEFPPKFIPSFSWGGAEGFIEHEFDKAVASARCVLERRDKEITPQMVRLYRHVFEMTEPQREALNF